MEEKCAEQSGYTVSDMDEFERQTMDMECRAVSLLDPARALAAGQADGQVIPAEEFDRLSAG